MRLLRLWVVVASLVAGSVSAQTVTGSLSGTVADNTGQVIPSADVTIISERTGESRTGKSNEVGDFAFPALAPGAYTIRVEMTGFKPLESKGNIVLANSRLAVGVLRIDVGALTESVTVSAVGEAVATTRTSHQAIIDLKQVENLSIRGRDPISLLKILPGVALLANDQETFGGSFATPVPNIQGGRGQTIYVDGINGGDGGGGGNFSAATNMDAIAEVNVQMSAYTAEYGLKGGAQVNIITKRGGSQYHGTGYWYKRHEMWNATNFFNNKVGQPKPVYRYSTLGGNLGGKVPKIPKIHASGDKLFFFYSVDDTQLKDANILRRYTMPTALERAGDFSQTRQPNGTLIPVRDPLTGLQFPDNKIPASRAHPQSLALMNILPMPNATGSGFNYLTQEPSIPHPRRQHLTRIDYRPTSSDSIAFKYQTWYTRSVGWEVAGRSAPWGLVRQRYDFTMDMAKIDYTRILGPRTVLEFSTGSFYSTETGPPENDEQLARIQRATYPALANMPQFAARNNPLGLIPKAQFGTLQSNSNEVPNITYDNRWPITGADTAFSAGLNITHTRGSHTFKAGVMDEFERFGQARSSIFAGEFSFANDGADPTNTGFAFANAFLGHVTSYTEALGRVPDNRRQNTIAWFVMDQWKVNRKLTVDIGLRMYKWGHPLQGGGEASAFSFERFDPNWGGNPPVLYRPVLSGGARRAQNPVTGEILPVTFVGLIVPGTGYTCDKAITPQTPCQINGIVVQENGDYVKGGRGFNEALPIQYDPRLGLAFAVNPKTVIRLAGGSFHDSTGGITNQGGPAFRYDKVVRYTDMNSFISGAAATALVPSVSGTVRTDQKRPNTYRFTLGVQRDIGWHMVLDAAYVGDRTKYLSQSWNYNAIPAGARFRPENRDLSVPDSATVGLDPSRPNPGALPDAFLRPIRGFNDITISSPSGSSTYDSMQMQLTRRFTGGFEAAGSYTWAKGFASGLNQNNPLPSSLARTRTGIQEHVLVASYTIDVPKGSTLIKSRFAAWVLDNWRLSGISTFATGLQSDVSASFTDSFDFSGGGETCGNIIQTGDAVLPRGERSVNRWFDTSVFKRPSGRGDIGNNCYNAKITLPGYNNHDLTIFKDFPMKRGQKMQFRFEIFNVLNHTQYNAVDTSAQFNAAGVQTDVNFGTVTSARNERRMQMGLRFSF